MLINLRKYFLMENGAQVAFLSTLSMGIVCNEHCILFRTSRTEELRGQLLLLYNIIIPLHSESEGYIDRTTRGNLRGSTGVRKYYQLCRPCVYYYITIQSDDCSCPRYNNVSGRKHVTLVSML